MKSIIKLVTKTVCFVFLAIVATGCDLEVQEKFHFNPEVDPQFTFGSMTPWEWIQTNPGGQFAILKQAIEITGMQAEYSNKTDKRTYFLIKDIGWTKASGGIFAGEFAKATSIVDPKVDVNKLRNLLRYHIVSTYVDQGPDNLFVLDKNYLFSTLYKVENDFDLMSINRDRNYILNLNRSPELIPAKKGAGVKLHNYIFSDGNSVAHLLEDYMKNNAFSTNP